MGIEPTDPESDHAYYIRMIRASERQQEEWIERGNKIIRRYKDHRSPREEGGSRYNILWSNIQTILPAIYNRTPKVVVERKDCKKDPLNRTASEVLERVLSYYVDQDHFSNIVKQAVLDRLLPGRGVVWVRYMAKTQEVGQLTDDTEAPREEGEPVGEEILDYEDVCVDYVHWEDYGENIARTQEEIGIRWRICYLTREELVNRFGEIGNEVPLDYSGEKTFKEGEKLREVDDWIKKASIYEIWDKKKRIVVWLHKDFETVLDRRQDPLGLPDFFPCPLPLCATTANDSTVPVPDYREYEDQAIELDNLTSRISMIQRALKVSGVYDSSAEGVQRILSEGIENQLVPVDSWAVFSDRGGLKGAIEFLPLVDIAKTLEYLYKIREQVKQDLYEITGLSDILRGATEANETATAQQIKGQYANMRLHQLQSDIQKFIRSIIRIMGAIIAEFFSIDTIRKISGVDLLTQVEKQAIQVQMQMPMIQGQQATLTEEIQAKLQKPTWEEVEALFRNEAILSFRIDIETDSTIRGDEEAEKASRMEFVDTMGKLLQQASQVSSPEVLPFVGELVGFAARAFRIGRGLEDSLDTMIERMNAAARQPKQEAADPELMRVQAEMQLEQLKGQQTMALEVKKLELQQQLDLHKLQQQMEMEKYKLEMQAQIELYKANLQAKTQLESSDINARASLAQAFLGEKEGGDKDIEGGEDDRLSKVMDQMNTSLEKAVLALSAPKQIITKRLPTGELIGEVNAGLS